MRRRRNTKIVATLGPASSTPEMIRALFEAGADVFRLNMSHGSQDDVRARHAAIRALEAEVGRPIGILADLQGPKLRVGRFRDGAVQLREGATFRLELSGEDGDETRAVLPHPEVFQALSTGTRLLLDDGKVALEVTEAGSDFAMTRVVEGGPLSNRKGVNVPNAVLPIAALTPKDLSDLDFVANLGVDWVALSFVQRPEDVAELRKHLRGRAAVMSKIEKPAALERLDEIIELSDGLMVARGDLGVELPIQEVPTSQKRITRACRRAGKPVIVATQMLESMVVQPVPTRAEVTDVATAVYEGADAIMLSAESASGAHPVEAVSMMDSIALQVEGDAYYPSITQAQRLEPEATAADALSAAARQVAETLRSAAIVTYTTSGSTALRAARERPRVPMLTLTPSIATARRLALCWGAHSVVTEDAHNFDEMVDKARATAKADGFAEPGQRIVITAGVPFGTPGTTNVLHVAWVT
ncbi:pyruvate kinase [Zavarzinia sp. CC-PAN008]|uniref:pyruvate kinase n=1 Tax=Zavarzinia sp. CC-PAN008 TaxID=3243332 RepID=UPI003F747426